MLGAGVLPFELFPRIETLREARDTLCGGQLDFVYGLDGTGVPFWSPSASGHVAAELGAWKMETKPIGYKRAVLESVLQGPDEKSCDSAACDPYSVAGISFTDDGSSTAEVDAFTAAQIEVSRKQCCLRSTAEVAGLKGGQYSLESMESQSVDAAAETQNWGCIDILDTFSASADRMRGAVGDVVDASACGGACPFYSSLCDINGTCVTPRCDLHANLYCNLETEQGERFRQLCPAACGCDAPRSHLVLSHPKGGCGECSAVSDRFKAEMAALPCTDVAVDDKEWLDFIDEFQAYAASLPGFISSSLIGYLEAFRVNGCASFSKSDHFGGFLYLWKMDPCRQFGEGGWPFYTKPFSHFCPAACGCRASDTHCPDSCAEDAIHWWDKNATLLPEVLTFWEAANAAATT